MQQVEQAKKTLESVFIEIIEAIRNNTGPIAERLLNEYSLRNYIQGFLGYIVCAACVFIELRIIKDLNKKALKHEQRHDYFDPTAHVLISLPVIIVGIVSLLIGTSGFMDAVSPLYSIIKSLK